jgi:3-deoxy-D-manno-octulosonate 8-phosphate phosphatase (KDO 8-P phosphatase)
MERANFKTLLKGLKGLLFDVDGVLTDNKVLLLESGELARSMSIRDGYALKRAVEQGMAVGVISGGAYDPIKDRLARLGVTEVHLDIDDKTRAFDGFLERNGLSAEELLYMGDDVPDLEVMKKAGLAACPYDAVHEVRSICGFVSNRNGGEGCVRDVVEQTLRAKGLWDRSKG